MKEASRLPSSMITCEAVLSEVHFLTGGFPSVIGTIEGWMADGWLAVALQVQGEHAAIHSLMARYTTVRMSFADACLVRLSELHPDAPVFTLDSDFRIYRRHKRQAIPLICP